MKTAQVIIGANFGDEGKGLVTDFHAACAGGGAVVVRFNGGAQAGHTVMTPEGKRHVFSHFSSGSFAGAATHLSRFFVCNPLLFMKEHAVLRKVCATPEISIDARAPVTTPYDMMLNQIAEEARGRGRHGSCGMGFGETIERHETAGFAVSAADLPQAAALKEKLAHIRAAWVPQRLAALGIRELPEKWRERIGSDAIADKFLDDTEAFLGMAQVADARFLADTPRPLVFEGAQGLLLDQSHEWFPHVTRSHTGLRNVLALAEEAGIGALDVSYITRAYATRHGAGPFPRELDRLPYPRIEDKTNVHNDYQGTLRFGWLDADILAASIKKDLSANRSNVKVRPGLAVTCLDQLDGEATYAANGNLATAASDDLPHLLQKMTGAEFLITARGPSRATAELR